MNQLRNLKNEADKLRLTAQEKTAMHARIFGLPAPAALTPKQSPYFIFSFQFLQARVLAPVMVMLVVFVGAGTAAAAQGSLPGDLLYPVKVSINESVQLALATTPVARAEVSAELAERRVEEAETLAARGSLTSETSEALAASFETHAQNAEDLATQIGESDPVAASELRTKLESSLSAHGAILATLTVGGAKENQEGVGTVAARVLSRTIASALPARGPAALRAKTGASQATVMNLMVAENASSTASTTGDVSLEGDMIQTAPQGDSADALRLQAQAQGAVADARALFDNNKQKLASVTQVSGEFADLAALMDLASTTLATGHFGEAEGDFTEALKRAIKLQVLLKAQATIKQNIITPILEQASGEATLEVELPDIEM